LIITILPTLLSVAFPIVKWFFRNRPLPQQINRPLFQEIGELEEFMEAANPAQFAPQVNRV